MERYSEKLLVLKAQGGDVSAFDLLYRAYTPSLLRFAKRLTKDRELADDAVQEAWISISKTLSKLRDPSLFRAWIFKAVRWRLLDEVRQGGDDTLSIDDIDEPVSDSEEQKSDRDDLLDLIARLDPIEREAVYLFYLEGMKIKEIAQVMDCPEGTIKSRLNRAREQLKSALEAIEEL